MSLDAGAVKVGSPGVAITPLRPAGRVQLGDRVIDVVSEIGYIPAGAPVKVVNVTDFRIGVEPA
jgi:membrane-bound serine protease (ClpP class)